MPREQLAAAVILMHHRKFKAPIIAGTFMRSVNTSLEASVPNHLLRREGIAATG